MQEKRNFWFGIVSLIIAIYTILIYFSLVMSIVYLNIKPNSTQYEIFEYLRRLGGLFIDGVAFGFISVGVFNILFGVIALIISVYGVEQINSLERKTGLQLARAGKILSIISLVISASYALFFLIALGTSGTPSTLT